MTKATARTQTDQVSEIAVGQLVRSRFEARKTMDQAALAELVESIRAKGVLEPLIVRPFPAPDDAREGELFEIGAGQRRWEASKLASKTTVPCIVREMSDEEFRELGIVSNLQRQDLEPMDEAEAYGKLMELPGATVETVAAKVAKAPSYVGRRLKLLDAAPAVREALKVGAIEVGHALELARLAPQAQRQLLSWMGTGAAALEPEDIEDDSDVEAGECRYCGCTEDDACDGGCSWANAEQTVCTNPECLAQFREEIGEGGGPDWRKTSVSLPDLKREIANRTLKDLNSAPFPIYAEDLGAQACTQCPKRSINQALLFNDLAGSDICTDRTCFDEKTRVWVKFELDTAAAEKRKLLCVADGWTDEKGVLRSYDVRIIEDGKACASAEEAIWVGGRNIGRRLQVCRDKNCKTHYSATYSSASRSRADQTPAQKAKEKQERAAVLEKLKTERAYRKALGLAVAQSEFVPESVPALVREVCVHLIGETNSNYAEKLADLLGWDKNLLDRWGDGRKKLRKVIAELPVERCLAIALLSTATDDLTVQEYGLAKKPEDLETCARLVGVDPARVRKDLDGGKETKPKPEPAAPAKKAANKASKPAKKPILSAAARKRIAEAQKKRWAQAAKPVAKKAGKATPTKKKAGRR